MLHIAKKRFLSCALLLCTLQLAGCPTPPVQKAKQETKSSLQQKTKPAPQKKYTAADIKHLPQLSREDFNRLAAKLQKNLFWRDDKQNPGTLDPQELVVLGVAPNMTRYVIAKRLTSDYYATYIALVEARRQETVARELDQGRPTLVETDFTTADATDKAVIKHITNAARIIEELYAIQDGVHNVRGCIKKNDHESRALLARNQGLWCLAPATEADPFCNACSSFPKKKSGLYPTDLQDDPKFCDKLAARPDAEQLFNPFVVIQGRGDQLKAVPYTRVWPKRMKKIAAELRLAAITLPKESEEAFRSYLLAAAKAFEDNNWEPADEAWAAMNVGNSKWYLRIAPDEVYFEPCNRKAGFHVSFAMIDKDSLYWQEKLSPLRQEMEQSVADLIGASYKARQVSVHLPDFIEIVLNAGDARSALGATIGQSLPNWGKVAREGRGRTVVMSNLYTDPDSKNIHRAQAQALLSKESMVHYSEDKKFGLLDIILHELNHNLGPHSDFKVNGKKPGKIFGGPLASTLEELKAQTGALYYIDFLRTKGLLAADEVYKVYISSISWCFGHIARGMFSASGKPKPYSQLAAIQIGFFMREGALSWDPTAPAANGQDKGCFTIHYDKLPAAINKLMQQVGRIKSTGDLKSAQALINDFITGEGARLMHMPEVKERLLRYPKASFVYSVKL